ncbi:MAG: hypothetical protein KGD67_10365 [Candidatus Lokiarchaeota archaeon]|nr:hypothetical protein [Candidatus Lokiarchaeota archaeon]
MIKNNMMFEIIKDHNFSVYISNKNDNEKHKWWVEKKKTIIDAWYPQIPRGKFLEDHNLFINPIVKQTYIEELMESIKNIPVHAATIDLGEIDLEEFNQTYLAKVLKKYNIPYFTLELPHYRKGQFLSQLLEIQKKYNQLKTNYDSLEEKNTPSAQELSYLITYYSNELTELKQYINQVVQTTSIISRILRVIQDLDSEDLTFIHIGEENTFDEIKKQAEQHNCKSNILFIQKTNMLFSTIKKQDNLIVGVSSA